MAEISPTAAPRERAQLFLVAAIGLAVTFVALALVLNTAIFTENLASRGSDTTAGPEAVRYSTEATDGIEPLIEKVNYNNNTTHAHLHANLSAGVTGWSNASGRLSAVDAKSSNLSGSTVNGTRIVQDATGRNFTDANENDDWLLAGDVSGTRGFWLNVSRSDLNSTEQSELPPSGSEAVFHVQFTDDAGDDWRIYVYQNANNANEVNVTVEEPSSGITGSCSAVGEHVVINITDATVGDNACSPLAFLPLIPTPYQLSYNDTTFSGGVGGDTVAGTYELIVDTPSVSGGNFHDDDAGESPYTTPAIYSLTLEMRYEGPRVFYNSSVRLAPGEQA